MVWLDFDLCQKWRIFSFIVYKHCHLLFLFSPERGFHPKEITTNPTRHYTLIPRWIFPQCVYSWVFLSDYREVWSSPDIFTSDFFSKFLTSPSSDLMKFFFSKTIYGWPLTIYSISKALLPKKRSNESNFLALNDTEWIRFKKKKRAVPF